MRQVTARQRFGSAFLVGLGLLAAFQPGQAQAGILIVPFSTSPSGGNTQYTYSVYLLPGVYTCFPAPL
jgi:hypothetical protein